MPGDWLKIMRGAKNLTKTIDSLLGKSKDWLSEIYDSKLWEKSSSPNRFAFSNKLDSMWYSADRHSWSWSKSRSLEWWKSSWKPSPHNNIELEEQLMGSVTP